MNQKFKTLSFNSGVFLMNQFARELIIACYS